MKVKSVFLMSVILLTLFTVTAIYAEDVTVGSSTFTLPDGFEVNETDGDRVCIANDTTYIWVYHGEVKNVDDAKQERIDKGYELIGEETYDYEGISINQQNYKKDGVNSCVYSFSKNNKDYIVVLSLPDGDEIPSGENSPVTTIVSSIQ